MRPCPVCSSGLVVGYGERATYQVGTRPTRLHTQKTDDGEYSVVECAKCEMVYTDLAPPSYEDHLGYVETSAWDRVRLAVTSEHIRRIAPRDARILDVGCANGTLLTLLRDLHPEGIDPSVPAVEAARERELAVTVGSVVYPSFVGMYDVVVCLHVLEHLHHPREAIKTLGSYLAPGGTLFLEVPDATRYNTHLVAPHHDFNTEHINHFSPRHLELLFKDWTLESFERRTVPCSSQDDYPVLTTTWTQTKTNLGVNIRDYISRSDRLLEDIDHHLVSQGVHAGQELLIWGAGELTKRLVHDTILSQTTILGIVDSTKRGEGIITPDEAKTFTCPVVIGSIHQQRDVHRSALIKLGPDRELITLTH